MASIRHYWCHLCSHLWTSSKGRCGQCCCSCPIAVTILAPCPYQEAIFLHLDLRHLLCQGRETAAEKRYRKLLLSGLELNKDFYFSYTYNLARTLQANLTAEAPADPFDSMFVWNEYLSRYEACHFSQCCVDSRGQQSSARTTRDSMHSVLFHCCYMGMPSLLLAVSR